MDSFALARANCLVGNPAAAAGIEIVLAGAAFTAASPTAIAVTGAPVTVSIDGQVRPMDACLHVPSGVTIEISRSDAGNYSYLAIAGGISTPPVFGSRSTVAREALGGLNGRPLQPGDTLPLGVPITVTPAARTNRRLGRTHRETPQAGLLTLRFLPGIHYQRAAPGCHEALQRQEFRVSGAANRMAIPLSGSPLDTGVEQLWSEATIYGSIQVPPSGEPLVLLNDRQTMGGYPQLGVVMPIDCVRLAQAQAGRRIRFEAISLDRANEILWHCNHYEATLVAALERRENLLS